MEVVKVSLVYEIIEKDGEDEKEKKIKNKKKEDLTKSEFNYIEKKKENLFIRLLRFLTIPKVINLSSKE